MDRIPEGLQGASRQRRDPGRGPRRRPGACARRRARARADADQNPDGEGSAAPVAGEFTTEAEAKGHCPTDTVVWVNTKSHKYHFAGHRSYGTTKKGAYMCETDAKAAGEAAAKGEKPKT